MLWSFPIAVIGGTVVRLHVTFLLLLVWLGGWWTEGWLHVKLLGVVALTAFHMWLAARRRHFAEGRNALSGRAYRIMNEVPLLLLILIVVMVIVKPF